MTRLLPLLLLLAACDDAARPSVWIDGGPRPDGGYPFGDAGFDAGPVVDAGLDAGGPARGRLRFANLSSSLGALDVYEVGNPLALARGVAYRGASGYAPVPVGDVALELRATGSTPADPPIATLDAIPIEADDVELVVFAGTLEALRVIRVDDRADEEPPLGTAYATVLHELGGFGTTSANLDDDPEPELSDLAPRGRADRVAIPVGEGAPTELADDARRSFGFTWVDGVDDGSTITLALVGEVDGVGEDAPGLLAILPETRGSSGTIFLRPDPEVALLQASPGVVEATVEVAGLAFGTLVFGDVVAPMRVPPGNAYVSVIGRDAGDESVFAGGTAGDLARGERYLVVLGGPTGFRDVRRFEVVSTRLAMTAPGTEARAHVVHVSEDAPAPLGLFLDGAPVEGVEVRYASRTPLPGIALPTGNRDVGFGTPGSVASWRFETTIPNGRVAYVVAGRYFATDPEAPDALGVLAVDLDAWRVTRLVGSPGSGPREGEEPPRPEEPGGGIGI
ncbi:MAG: DUF4397 domain-containing protein [Sandaracinus sp.]|nr:DUF4397 domain-containing protein [Sandaracinus sp.]MCB9613569.1 DUF4397 domain-containing protein [Sandaracinus sp.]